ncbi:TonB-dependent receptor domain-containing protein [Erythrobacter alti]|uniref:TonB-dependent receptor domain-containing protein n=1 Tax=Erythrobacter alti TaxID=1896145 RepID=UPI0030F41926
MKNLRRTALTGLAISVSAGALLAGGAAFAQDAAEATGVTNNDPDEQVVVDVDDTGAQGANEEGSIVVTGSRVRRADTYSSTSPLQVLDTEAARDVGEFDAAQILQRSEAAAGQQIDATFQGFVLDNGPGSQTLNLRGLGANRTLLMINGRRLAPAGVEGAPTSPSINLLPSSLIERYDLLLDGASSVYGSDAVAGVGNVILRTDIDGFELFGSGSVNPDGGGDDYTVSGAWGTTFDRGFFGIGAEYAYRDEIKLSDREWFNGCRTDYEITNQGDIRRIGVSDRAILENQTGGAISIPNNECVLTGFTGRIFQTNSFGGSAYYVGPGGSNYPGFPDFPYADSSNAFGAQLDRDGDGIRDIDFYDFNTNGTNLEQSFITQQKLYNVMAYGEYSLGGEMNITPFFEALYSRAEVFSDNTGSPSIFPSVPDLNPFNPCNIDTNPNGVDCRLLDNFQADTFGDLNGTRPGSFDVYAAPGVPFGRGNYGMSLPVDANAQIRGDRNNQDVTQEQYRGVLGVRGDLPFFGDSWSFEVSGVYSRSEGRSIRRGIREDRLAYSLGIDPTADFDGDGVADNNGDGIADDYDNNYEVFGQPLVNIGDSRDGGTRPGANFVGDDPRYIGPCGTLSNPNLAAPDLVQGCVPVNLFADSIFQLPFGDFASQAERDYLFGVRQVDTTYEQIVLSAYATGDLVELPAGPLAVVLGGEFRHDSISTVPDISAFNGLFFGFFRDFGTNGDKYIVEAFGELNVPVFDSDFWGEFNVNAAGRVSEEEFYGTAGTYSLKADWRPVPQVLLKATYGTSFRAPNLRENFLGGITGFTTVGDPCAVPAAAFQPLASADRPAGYQADLDTRDAALLAICRDEGRDPTRVGISPAGTNTIGASSIEVANRGTLDLDPETSKSFTTGVAVAENFGNFDVSFNFNYYSIIVEGSIAELSAQFTVNDCYDTTDVTLTPAGELPASYDRSIYCDQLVYSGGRQLITQAFPLFLNQDKETVRGIDINASFGYEVPLGGDILDLGLTLQANHLIERSTLFILDDEEDFDDFTGEFGFPEWTGRAIASVGYGPVTLTWQTRWIGETEQQASGIDPLSDAFGRGPDGQPTGVIGDTCLGNGSGSNDPATGAFIPNGVVEGDGVFCRDIGFADDYFVHNASIRYNFNELMTLRLGVSNIFNTAPPLVDGTEVFSVNNVPIGNGYDLDGREFFGSLSVRF